MFKETNLPAIEMSEIIKNQRSQTPQLREAVTKFPQVRKSFGFSTLLRPRTCALHLLSLALLLYPLCALARINVVTLPGRDSVQLTIYNSVDLTMVKETRLLTFRKGLNRLEFSWANTLIDPTSVEFHALDHEDAVDVLDVSFPPRVTNTLDWRINSGFAGEVEVEIRYFTSGISWSADCLAEVNKGEKLMNLAGYVRVNNNSGEDYENAQVRLVVGVIRLVEDIANLARMGRPGAQPPAAPMAAAAPSVELKREFGARLRLMENRAANGVAEVIKEELSEY